MIKLITLLESISKFTANTSVFNNTIAITFSIDSNNPATDSEHYDINFDIDVSGFYSMKYENRSGYVNFKTQELFLNNPIILKDFKTKKEKPVKKIKLKYDDLKRIPKDSNTFKL